MPVDPPMPYAPATATGRIVPAVAQRLIALAVYLVGALIGGFAAIHALSIAPIVPLAEIVMLVIGLASRACELGSIPA